MSSGVYPFYIVEWSRRDAHIEVYDEKLEITLSAFFDFFGIADMMAGC